MFKVCFLVTAAKGSDCTGSSVVIFEVRIQIMVTFRVDPHILFVYPSIHPFIHPSMVAYNHNLSSLVNKAHGHHSELTKKIERNCSLSATAQTTQWITCRASPIFGDNLMECSLSADEKTVTKQPIKSLHFGVMSDNSLLHSARATAF